MGPFDSGNSYGDCSTEVACDLMKEIVMGHLWKLDDKVGDATVVKLTDDEVEQARRFACDVAAAKRREGGEYASDPKSLEKRFLTGIIGEIAVMKLLGIDVAHVDMEIGITKAFAYPDLSHVGIDAGVKTVTGNMFPLVYPNSNENEVICLKRDDNTVIVCGVASASVIRENCSEMFVLNKQAITNKPRGRSKAGFYGFRHLDIFTGIDDLPDYVSVDRKLVSRLS